MWPRTLPMVRSFLSVITRRCRSFSVHHCSPVPAPIQALARSTAGGVGGRAPRAPPPAAGRRRFAGFVPRFCPVSTRFYGLLSAGAFRLSSWRFRSVLRPGAMAAGISPPPIPAATPGSVSTPSSATPACKVRWGAGPVGGGSALAVPAFPAVPLGPADDSHAGVLVHVPSSDESFGEGKVNIAVELEALQNGIAPRRAAETTLRRMATKARAMLASDKRRRSLESGLSTVMAENQAEDSVKEKAGCPAVAVTPGRAQSWTTDLFRPACLLRSPVRPRWSDCRPSTPGRRPGADPAGIQPRRGAPPS